MTSQLVAAGVAPAATAPGRTMLQPLQTSLEPEPDAALVDDFLDALSTLASSVVLVTCRVHGRPWAMTVTAFCSVSTEPPTVLVSLGAETAAARAIGETDRFGVSILGEEQEPIARRGSRPGAEKYLEDSLDPTAGRSSSPAVAGAVSHLDCDVIDTIQVADHVLVLGRVCAARAANAEASPLVYHRRRFRRLAGARPTRPSQLRTRIG